MLKKQDLKKKLVLLHPTQLWHVVYAKSESTIFVVISLTTRTLLKVTVNQIRN